MKQEHMRAVVDYHHHMARLDKNDSDEVKVWHLLVSLIGYCERLDPNYGITSPEALLTMARDYYTHHGDGP